MTTFTVNGQRIETEQKKKLLFFLRDELKITSVKDGCSQGACGACTVLIDGEPSKACVPDIQTLEGKEIITVEGLSDWEKEVLTWAYGEAGAVQCGFCIPGMVLCTKALLDRNVNPTEEEIRFALRNNYCRCTGYVKIIEAVKLAAKVYREKQIPTEKAGDWQVGSRMQRIDVEEKVLGYGKYPNDYYFDDMCYGIMLRSKYARARVLSIDTSRAEAVPGVIGVFTAADVPGENLIGHIKHDQYVMVPVGSLTHYLGDVIAVVAAETLEIAKRARKLIKVEYEVLPAVHNIQEAAAPDAPLVFEEEENNIQAYKHVSRGNAEEAIAQAAHVVSGHFETPWTEHAFLEPESAVAFMDEEGDVVLYTTDQSAHTTLHEVTLALGTKKVKVQNALVGGGFGGKEDMTVQPFAALITLLTGRSCKVTLSREESMLVHPKRHHFEMDVTMGCDSDGKILGVKANVVSDTGAYASLGGPVLERACTHAAGPYAYENFEIEGRAYYTNNPPAGAFRGFGVTQTCFATESLLDMVAEKVGISTWEIRYRNAIRPGGVLPNGQIVDEATGLVETLEAIKEPYEAAVKAGKPVGIACAMKNAGVGVGLLDYGRVKLVIEEDEKIHIYSGASCIGQGLGTVLVQMVATNTCFDRETIVYERNNTWIAPDSGDTSGSRQTLVTGEACCRACEKLMEEIHAGKTLVDLVGQTFYGEYLAKTDPLGANVPNPVSHVAYGYATQMCILEKETGKIEEMYAAHDVGKAVNPLSCEGQIEGGVVMSMGYALREQFPIDEKCKPIQKYGSLGLFRAHEIPTIHAIVIDKPGFDKACGAKGIGEITSIPTAPAIAEAYYQWDGERRYELPLVHTPYEKTRPGTDSDEDRIVLRNEKQSEITSVQYTGGCVNCHACEKLCPTGAIRIINGTPTIRENLCLNCGMCVARCPEGVLVDGKGIIKGKKGGNK